MRVAHGVVGEDSQSFSGPVDPFTDDTLPPDVETIASDVERERDEEETIGEAKDVHVASVGT